MNGWAERMDGELRRDCREVRDGETGGKEG